MTFFGEAVSITPEDHRHHGKLAGAQRFVPRVEDNAQATYEKAIKLVRAQLAVNPDEPEDLRFLSLYLVRTGDMIEARRSIDRSLELAPESPDGHYFAALLEIEAGNVQKSLDQLEKAANLGYSLRMMEKDPDLQKLYKEERFRTLIE